MIILKFEIQYEPIADVATDKLFTTIPSEFTGRVHKRFHAEGKLIELTLVYTYDF